MGSAQNPPTGPEQHEYAAPHYALRLFVAGASPGARRAVSMVTALCEAHLRGRYTLEVIDIYQQPELTIAENVLATPTLIRLAPPTRCVMIGDLSDTARVLRHLEIVDPAGPSCA